MQRRNIIFVVGAGAVENSWDPVVRAINKAFDIQTDAEGANFLFARHICVLKFYAKVGSKGHYPEVYEMMKSNISILKNTICNELKIAQESGEIKPRKNFNAIVNKFVTPKPTDKAWLVSTNWDEVIDMEINKLYRSNNPDINFVTSFHIHGCISSPDQIYLPSEVTHEIYRMDEDKRKLGLNHSDFMHMIQYCNRTVLYGLSLDPLDAELSQSLAAGWDSPNNQEIIIIDPNHGKVAKRVKLLLEKKHNVKVIGYHPDNIDKEIVYE